MSRNIPPVTGMKDVLAADIGLWQHVERCARSVMDTYGYEEIRVPVVEHTELFKRAIGEYTDVVEKEMYTFTDQGGDSLTLRPEATAGIVRATISNRRKAGSASSTRSTSRLSASPAPMSTSKSSRSARDCGSC